MEANQVTIQSEAFKMIMNKLDKIYAYVNNSTAFIEKKNTPIGSEKWLMPDEAAAILNISRRTLLRLRSAGEISYNKLFESIPILKEYDFIMRLCETIKTPFEIVKQIFSGKKVPFSIGKSRENKPLLAINDVYYGQWFKEQKNKFLENLGIKVNETKNQRGFCFICFFLFINISNII